MRTVTVSGRPSPSTSARRRPPCRQRGRLAICECDGQLRCVRPDAEPPATARPANAARTAAHPRTRLQRFTPVLSQRRHSRATRNAVISATGRSADDLTQEGQTGRSRRSARWPGAASQSRARGTGPRSPSPVLRMPSASLSPAPGSEEDPGVASTRRERIGEPSLVWPSPRVSSFGWRRCSPPRRLRHVTGSCSAPYLVSRGSDPED